MSTEEENVDVDGLSGSEEQSYYSDEDEEYQDDDEEEDVSAINSSCFQQSYYSDEDDEYQDDDEEEGDQEGDDDNAEDHPAGHMQDIVVAGRRAPKRKVAHHNALEKQRRNDLTTAFDTLLKTIKRDASPLPKLSRDGIVAEATKKLQFMTEEQEQIEALTLRAKRFRDEILHVKKKLEEEGLVFSKEERSTTSGSTSRAESTSHADDSRGSGRKRKTTQAGSGRKVQKTN